MVRAGAGIALRPSKRAFNKTRFKRKRTAPTMLVRIGRQAIEDLVKEGVGDVEVDGDLEALKARRSN